MVWSILCILVAVMCILGFGFVQTGIDKLGERFELPKRITGPAEYIALGLFALTFIGVAASPLYYEFPTTSGDLYSIADDGTLTKHTFGTFEDGKTLAYLKEIDIKKWGDEYQRLSSVAIVTENPKVRRISYTARAHITDARTFLSVRENRDTSANWDNRLNHAVTSKLEFCEYEFNNAHSKEIAGFYNPRDSEQVRRFQELVGGYLNECLSGAGISAFVVSFDIS